MYNRTSHITFEDLPSDVQKGMSTPASDAHKSSLQPLNTSDCLKDSPMITSVVLPEHATVASAPMHKGETSAKEKRQRKSSVANQGLFTSKTPRTVFASPSTLPLVETIIRKIDVPNSRSYELSADEVNWLKGRAVEYNGIVSQITPEESLRILIEMYDNRRNKYIDALYQNKALHTHLKTLSHEILYALFTSFLNSKKFANFSNDIWLNDKHFVNWVFKNHYKRVTYIFLNSAEYYSSGIAKAIWFRKEDSRDWFLNWNNQEELTKLINHLHKLPGVIVVELLAPNTPVRKIFQAMKGEKLYSLYMNFSNCKHSYASLEFLFSLLDDVSIVDKIWQAISNANGNVTDQFIDAVERRKAELYSVTLMLNSGQRHFKI